MALLVVSRLMRLWDVPPSSLSEWDALLVYTRLYGLQVVLLALLSAMTVYRREMSVNHVYHPPDTTNRKESKKQSQAPEVVQWDECAEEFLEGAGNYCSGEPLLAVALSLLAHLFYQQSLSPQSCSLVSRNTTKRDELLAEKRVSASSSSTSHSSSSSKTLAIVEGLPGDVQTHLFSFLHPRDVTNFGCASRSSQSILKHSTTLWRSLWYRDYAWLVHKWKVGRNALCRSLELPESVDDITLVRHQDSLVEWTQSFYFSFGQSYMNYVLAGQNTHASCLVGLHGHVYDLTDFLDDHPGSPDTLLVHAGREATHDFETMNHSGAARRLATSLCICVDANCEASSQATGVHPTKHASLLTDIPFKRNPVAVPLGRRTDLQRPATLRSIRARYDREEQLTLMKVSQRHHNENVLGHVRVFYDPFCQRWKAWYTDATSFDTVYIHDC